ncbi:MAG TPA: hypothetical protein VLL76_11910 [Candidatus Omnitrophota bacterium]|nr:hypothetical protein [Candidatus Omnitrophota bacterium]
MTQDFTVIGWCTQSYKHLAEGVREDCRRLGYRYHLYEIDDEYNSLMAAWCNHPRIIRRGVEDFGTVLFLDIECRILRPLPPHWRAPLVSVRLPEQKFWIRYNSGTVMADRDSLPWLDTWIAILEDWRMGELEPADFVHWPGDLCDELALAAALAAHRVKVATPGLEYVDRGNLAAELARGLWRNEATVIQHPTIHHWPKEHDPVECKKLFWQNTPGTPEAAAALFATDEGEVRRDGWVFDPATRRYAPQEFWPDHARPWIDDPVTLTSAQR